MLFTVHDEEGWGRVSILGAAAAAAFILAKSGPAAPAVAAGALIIVTGVSIIKSLKKY